MSIKKIGNCVVTLDDTFIGKNFKWIHINEYAFTHFWLTKLTKEERDYLESVVNLNEAFGMTNEVAAMYVSSNICIIVCDVRELSHLINFTARSVFQMFKYLEGTSEDTVPVNKYSTVLGNILEAVIKNYEEEYTA